MPVDKTLHAFYHCPLYIKIHGSLHTRYGIYKSWHLTLKLDWYIRIAFSKFLRIWQVCGLNDHKLQRHGECLLRYHSDIFLVHSLTFSAQFTLFCFASTSRTPLPETFRKLRRATVPYRCVPNETTFYRENQISGIHNKCVSVLCTLYHLFIWEKN